MKLHGEYVVRTVLDSVVAVPVGETALQLGGMVMLNEVSRVIWTCLERETTVADIVAAVTDAFEVDAAEAKADVLAFIDQLRDAGLLEE